MPIIEPEVTISIADKAEAEDMLLAETHARSSTRWPRPAGDAEAHAAEQGRISTRRWSLIRR